MRFGVVTDVHLAPREKPATAWHNIIDFARGEQLLERALGFFREAEVEGVLILGDLVHDGDDPSLRRGIELIASAGLPIRIVPGNHDGEGAWRDAIGGAGDSIRAADGDRIAIRDVTEFNYHPDTELWQAALPELPDAPAVVLTHAPVLSCQEALDAAELRFAGGFAWDGAAEALTGRDQPTVLLHGHLHVRMELAAGPVLQLGFAALIEAPHAVAVLELETTGDDFVVSVAHHSVAEYDVAVVPVLSPAVSRWVARNGTWQVMTG